MWAAQPVDLSIPSVAYSKAMPHRQPSIFSIITSIHHPLGPPQCIRSSSASGKIKLKLNSILSYEGKSRSNDFTWQDMYKSLLTSIRSTQVIE